MLLLDPGRAVLADPVVVHHRPAQPQGLLDDDRVQRLVVELDLLAGAGVDRVVVDEVEVRPGLVAVRGVRAQHGQVSQAGELAPDPGHDGVVQLADPRPVDRHLGGVPEVVIPEHGGLLGVDLVLAPVEVLEPVPDAADVHALVGPGGEEFLDRLRGGVGQALRALGDEDDDVLALVEVGKVLPGVLGRVDPAHRGPVPRGDQLADGVDAVGELVDQEAEVPVVLRLVAEELDRHLGDEAQGALAADHDVADVRARGPAGHVLDPGDLPAGEDGLQAHDHVLDSAVEGGELADRPGGDQAAQLGERLGLRGVPRGQAAGPHGVLQHLQADAALHGGHHVDRVDRQDRVHPRPVDHEAVLDHGLQPALGRGPPGAGDDVDEVVVGEAQDGRHLLGRGGIDDRGRDRPVVDAVDGGVLLEPVDAGLLQLLVAGLDGARPEQVGHRLDDRLAAQRGSGWGHGQFCSFSFSQQLVGVSGRGTRRRRPGRGR